MGQDLSVLLVGYPLVSVLVNCSLVISARIAQTLALKDLSVMGRKLLYSFVGSFHTMYIITNIPFCFYFSRS